MKVINHQKLNLRSGCPISCALDLVGDKWSILIIRDMCFFGKKTFSEFALSDEKIAANILADRLKKFESYGLVTKHKSLENKKTVQYALTQKGIDFVPIILELVLWGAKHLDTNITDEAKSFAKKIQKDKEAVIKQVYDNFSLTLN
jgi:DNA-binding HxlR family transcriptional regulator